MNKCVEPVSSHYIFYIKSSQQEWIKITFDIYIVTMFIDGFHRAYITEASKKLVRAWRVNLTPLASSGMLASNVRDLVSMHVLVSRQASHAGDGGSNPARSRSSRTGYIWCRDPDGSEVQGEVKQRQASKSWPSKPNSSGLKR